MDIQYRLRTNRAHSANTYYIHDAKLLNSCSNALIFNSNVYFPIHNNFLDLMQCLEDYSKKYLDPETVVTTTPASTI